MPCRSAMTMEDVKRRTDPRLGKWAGSGQQGKYHSENDGEFHVVDV